MSWMVRLVDRDGGFICERILHRKLLPPAVAVRDSSLIDVTHPSLGRDYQRFELSVALSREDGGPLAVYRLACENGPDGS